jgi:pyruvate/2-oxoacid:ferredoxin oxidoreductase alpha subunit
VGGHVKVRLYRPSRRSISSRLFRTVKHIAVLDAPRNPVRKGTLFLDVATVIKDSRPAVSVIGRVRSLLKEFTPPW